MEYEIDKTLNIKGPEDVAKMGIDKYNAECRSIVMRYAGEWEKTVNRLGRWIDFKNDYKTLYPWYMESIWWVFKQLWDKDLIYKGFRVMPYSTGCCTPLANFEASQNYKDVIDPAVYVSFPLDEDPNVLMVAWTTTPWTLPSNMALCVHPELEYVKLKEKSGKTLIMMKARVPALYPKEDEVTILETFKGETLRNKGYKPIFNYFAEYKQKGAFRILCDTYVTEESGTGVVHQVMIRLRLVLTSNMTLHLLNRLLTLERMIIECVWRPESSPVIKTSFALWMTLASLSSPWSTLKDNTSRMLTRTSSRS